MRSYLLTLSALILLFSGISAFAQDAPAVSTTLRGEGDSSQTSATISPDGVVTFKVDGKAVAKEEEEEAGETNEILVSGLSAEDEGIQGSIRSYLEEAFLDLESQQTADPTSVTDSQLLAIASFLQTFPGFDPVFQQRLTNTVQRLSPPPPPPVMPTVVEDEVDDSQVTDPTLFFDSVQVTDPIDVNNTYAAP